MQSLLPHLLRFSHGNPHVGVDHIRSRNAFCHILRQTNRTACLFGNLPTGFYQIFFREIFFVGAGSEIHSHLGTCHHQGIAHVVTGIPHVCKFNALNTPEMLPYGQKVGQHLGRMELVGQSVPDGHTRMFGKFFHDLLPETTVLNAFIHTPKNPRRIRNALLFADLGARRIQIGASHTEIMSRHLKGAACSGAGLLKDQGYVFSAKPVHRNPSLLFVLQIRRHVQHVQNLLRSKIQKF